MEDGVIEHKGRRRWKREALHRAESAMGKLVTTSPKVAIRVSPDGDSGSLTTRQSEKDSICSCRQAGIHAWRTRVTEHWCCPMQGVGGGGGGGGCNRFDEFVLHEPDWVGLDHQRAAALRWGEAGQGRAGWEGSVRYLEAWCISARYPWARHRRGVRRPQSPSLDWSFVKEIFSS